MKELMHQARGKPSPVHMLPILHTPEPQPLTLPEIDRKIEELLIKISVESRKSRDKEKVIDVAPSEQGQ